MNTFTQHWSQLAMLRGEQIERLFAAKKAVGIINRFRPGPYKAKHQSRTFKRMNLLRGSIAECERAVLQSWTATS